MLALRNISLTSLHFSRNESGLDEETIKFFVETPGISIMLGKKHFSTMVPYS